MLEILKTLKDTPLPIVLVIGGLIFLLIPFIQKINAKEVGVETTNQPLAGFIGFILLIVGVGLYIIPSGTTTSTPPTTIQPTLISAVESPIVELATQVIQPQVVPTTILVQPTNSLPPTQISSAPFIPHTVESIGTGIFSQATYSDGSAVFSQQELNTSHSKIQLINPDSSSNGCGTAWYTVNEVWFGGASKTTLYLNGVAVGEIFQGVGRHGYMIPLSVNAGDELCVKPIPPGGWNMNLGADIYYHYDSFCHRGYC